MVVLPHIYKYLVCGFFIKPLDERHLNIFKIFIIISISTNIYRPYVCDSLGRYIDNFNARFFGKSTSKKPNADQELDSKPFFTISVSGKISQEVIACPDLKINL